jgi:hypothetical protein
MAVWRDFLIYLLVCLRLPLDQVVKVRAVDARPEHLAPGDSQDGLNVSAPHHTHPTSASFKFV